MTPETIKEWTEALYGRYHKATRKEKKTILDEFCATTHYHRKAAIRLLRREPQRSQRSKQRSRSYGAEVENLIRTIDRALDLRATRSALPHPRGYTPGHRRRLCCPHGIHTSLEEEGAR
jgi:hypothetical protein